MYKFTTGIILTKEYTLAMITLSVATGGRAMIGIYCRVSTEEQAKQGYSIRNQMDECTQKAGTSDVIPYIDEGYSGEFLERPALKKLRQDIRDGKIETIVIYDPDRLSRKLMNQLILDDEFRKQGVTVVYVNGEYEKTPEGQLFYSMRGAISEFEKAKITERMSSGRKRKALEGKVIRYTNVYGYDKDGDKLKINEDEARIVKLIFDKFTSNAGMNGIAKELTKKGVPTKKGKNVWHRQVVRQILMNPIYKGVFYQNRYDTRGYLELKAKGLPRNDKMRDESEWIGVEVPAIVEEEQWNFAQDLLDQSRRRFAKQSKENYLLSGLIRCTGCGNTMTGVLRSNWGEKVRNYTDVKNTAGAKHEGCRNYIKADTIETVIWESVLSLLHDPEKMAAHRNEMNTDFEQSEIERLKKEVEKRKNGRKKLMKLFALEDADDNEIMEQIQEFKKEEEQFTEQIKQYESILTHKPTDNQKVIEGILRDYLTKDVLSFEDKQQIIRTLVKEIRVHDKDNVDLILF